MRPTVYLIGAGPGDPELITIKAARRLARADVVLVDDLVDRRVLVHASPHALIISVGKRGGERSTTQRAIERLMVRLARQGRIVARLKGGDPFVFGRGGEEVAALARHGIACEVVSGITAGMAVPAAAGIPLTHRGASHGVTFVTGHTAEGDEPDWVALARARTTLVVYMGLARLPRITARLLAGGLPPSTPAIAIEHGTLPGQRDVRATLATFAARVIAAGLKSPTLLVIGDVVALAHDALPAADALSPLLRAA